MKDDVTVFVLREIRDEVRELRGEVRSTNARLDLTNTRLDQTGAAMREGFDGLSRRLVESEMRTATALVDLAGSVREVTSLLREQHDLRPRIEKCETEIGEIKKRLRPRPA